MAKFVSVISSVVLLTALNYVYTAGLSMSEMDCLMESNLTIDDLPNALTNALSPPNCYATCVMKKNKMIEENRININNIMDNPNCPPLQAVYNDTMKPEDINQCATDATNAENDICPMGAAFMKCVSNL